MIAYFVQALVAAKQDEEEFKTSLENILSVFDYVELWDAAPVEEIIRNGNLENAKNVAKFELLEDQLGILKEYTKRYEDRIKELESRLVKAEDGGEE